MEADILAAHFNDPDAAREFLETQRWPEGPECPHCGIIGEAYRLTADLENKKAKTHARKGVWKCAACREQFTVTVGTIMEDSHIPLNKWLFAFHLLSASKKGMSAHQLHRMLGVTYKSAWFMAHRIRYAMSQEPLSSKLRGTFEIDETYIGGKRRMPNRSQAASGRPDPARNPRLNKAPVVSLLQRGGKVQSFHVERVTSENLRPIVKSIVAEGSHVMTDSSTALKFTRKEYRHDTVNHAQGEYVRREDGVCITTNAAEGYFSILKRGINGVYHHVGRNHLHRYLSEFDFRYNAREISDVERRNLAIQQVGGKRLMYRDSCGKIA
jgi:transposase-like protein